MKPFADPNMDISKYAAATADVFIRCLVFQVNRTAKHCDADAVHDLRVATRRLSQCLRAFSILFPRRASRKIARRLARLRRLAGEVRNRDIAIEYLRRAGPRTQVARRMAVERRQTAAELHAALVSFRNREPWLKWKDRLGI